VLPESCCQQNTVGELIVSTSLETDMAPRTSTHNANEPGWTFLSNHAHVLVCLAEDPDIRLRDVATRVGITERAVQRIVADLVEAGHVTRRKRGRVNHYRIHRHQPLRHPIEMHRSVGNLLGSLARIPTVAKRAGAPVEQAEVLPRVEI